MTPLRSTLLLSFSLLSLPSALRAAPPVGFEEKFALAPDRAAVLNDLIPGTPEYYYYSALHAQNSGKSPETARLLKEWATRFPEENNQRTLLETRQRFLDYSTNPKATLAWLKETAGLAFDHARETAGTPPEIPTSLDPGLISWDAFYAAATASDPQLGTLTDSGLRALFHRGLAQDLPAETRRAVLARLTRPDLAGLTDLILADLKSKASRGFGEFPIHRNLLLDQLAILLKAQPTLLGQRVFVETWLTRLAPPDGADPDRDPPVRLAWLERLQTFADTLPPAFNTIKASILHARLQFDLKQNAPDAARLIAYLKLPRPVPYVSPAFRESPEFSRFPVDFSLDLTPFTGHGPIRDDTAVVRRTLLLLLAKNPDITAFQPLLEATFLNALLAEAQLTTAPAAADKFTSLLPPAALQQLRTRTDLEFDPACREIWLPEDEVTLDLHLKNIPRLLVKVFEINTENVHRTTGRQVNTDLDLDGLVANREFSQDSNEAPLQRSKRTFKFPELNGKRGVWIIEFIGGGKSSRALVRKGGLTVLPIQNGAGTRLTILDEKSAPVPTAYALLGSQRFPADHKGHILLPFSTTPGEQNVIIHDGTGFTSLESITLQGETYSLNAGLHVPRESLLPGTTATVLIRPALLCNGRPTTLTALENPKLTLTATTLEGIPSTTVFPLKDLSPDKETTVSFQVPDRLAGLSFEISGEVKSLLTSQPVQVSSNQIIEVNGITLTNHTSDLQLTPGKDGWTLSELGRSGEPLAERQLNLTATHRDFANSIDTSLRTEANGSAKLGSLSGLTAISARNAGELNRIFPLSRDNASQPSEVHAAAGAPIRLAWPWQVPAADPVVRPSRPEVSILETRNNQFIRSITEGIAFKNGILEITGLPPGTYSLLMEENPGQITLRVAQGKAVDNHLLNPAQTLELSDLNPVAVTGLTPSKITPKDATVPVDALTIHLANATPDTRVHLLVSRFAPEFDAFKSLGNHALPSPLALMNAFRPSLYQSARTIGEEYRYVLERQNRPAFAGNFLPRPGLQLNPWAIADTTTEKQEAAAGEAPEAMVAERKKQVQEKMPSEVADRFRLDQKANGMAKRSEAVDAFAAAPDGSALAIAPPAASADLSFLAQPGATAFNLKPDANGNVHLATAALGHGQFLRVIALSGDSAAVRDFTLPEKPLQTRDLRLAKGLDPAGHFTQQNAVTVLEKDVPFTLKDALSSRYQTYGNLNSAWDLLYNLSKNPTLAEFAFLRTWPALDDAAKCTFYSKYACHELSFFLSRKDPSFFKTVVQPYLANKRDQTFLDRYLLENDLTSDLALPRYAALNTAEKLTLARRLDAAQLKANRRDLSDFLDTIPRDPARDVFWFESALGGKLLETSYNEDGVVVAAAAPADPFASADAPTGFSAPMPPPAPASAAPTNLPSIDELKDMSSLSLNGASAASGNRRGLGPEEEQLLRTAAKEKALYRQTELTKEWAENNYWKLPIDDQNADLIEPNRFWKDYALWDGITPFLSANLSEAANNFSEIMLALAVLDLPFESEAKPAKSEMKDGVLTLTPSTRSLLFHQEIKSAQPDKDGPPLLVSQNFYREGDRYLEENGEKSDNFVTGEFLTGTVYGCQIVVTNPGSARRKLDVLFQIPAGSLPVKQTRTTQSIPVQLDAFRTQTLDFHFYFPQPGAFAHYPVHVSRDGKVAASAAPATFKVVNTLTTLDKTSWDYLSQQGTTDQVLAYLDKNNLHQTDLESIAWRLKDRAFYDKTVALLRSRKFYDETVFSYSVLHNDLPALRDYLALQDDLPEEPLDSPLLTINPVEQKTFQWLEYSPLVNARAHQLGSNRVILNDKFRQQYDAFLHLLSFRAAFTAEDQLGLTAVMLLQDRLDEASAAFAKVDPAKIHERLQYDYLQAWLAFSAADLPTARSIATARTSTPLPDHWAAKFQELTAQLDEIDGKTPAAPRPEDREATQDRRAAAEPQFAVKVEGKAVLLDYRNLTEVTVNYYPMDLEFLFSANPFVGQDTSRFRSIRPNQTERLTLAPGKTTHSFPLPAAWQTTNVLVEITAAGQTKAVASYANQLDVQVSENYGQLQVRHAGDQRPLPRTYVKVFAEINGRPVFYKDGYTDLRGKFDYTGLSTADLDQTNRFSLLILTQDHGATVREVKPPAR